MTASQLVDHTRSLIRCSTGPTPPVTLTTGPIPTSTHLALHACPAQTGLERDGGWAVGGWAAHGRVLGQVRRAMCSKERSE